MRPNCSNLVADVIRQLREQQVECSNYVTANSESLQLQRMAITIFLSMNLNSLFELRQLGLPIEMQEDVTLIPQQEHILRVRIVLDEHSPVVRISNPFEPR